MNVSIVGLGKLGSCMTAVFAAKGHQVIGFDVDQEKMIAIAQGRAPVSETQLSTLLWENRERIQMTSTLTEALEHTSITFIIVPTPSQSDGLFALDFVVQACRALGAALKEKKGYHLVVLTSTVLPNDCQKKIIPVLEAESEKVCSQDFGFCYSPLFIAIGSVIHNLLTPDFFLVGESDSQAGEILESFYQTIPDVQAPVKRMTIPNAELTKISVNSYITMKITFANMLTEMAECIPGADIDVITEAIGSDSRIGKKYLKGGLGFGGPCFPRDNRALASSAQALGLQVPFAEKIDIYNRSVIERSVQKIIKTTSEKEDVIGILGLSYKPETSLCEESQAIAIIRALIEKQFTVHVHNPDGHGHARELLGERVTYHEQIESCVQASSILFLSHVFFQPERLVPLLAQKNHVTIIDPWRQMSSIIHTIPSVHISYLPYGRG